MHFRAICNMPNQLCTCSPVAMADRQNIRAFRTFQIMTPAMRQAPGERTRQQPKISPKAGRK
jgi:hypothetical protein